jgi:DNA-binding transcriptional ArsR family regulator
MDKLLVFARVLGDETRQEIMRLLCCQELSVNDIVAELAAQGKQLTQPTVSHHLAELRDADLVTARKEGRQTFYTLNQKQVTVCCGQIMACFAPEISLEQIRKEN